MTQLHPTEPAATFELSLPAEQVAGFFAAVAWQLPARPVTPPTIATVFRKGEFLALQKLGVQLERVLHGEQKYRFHEELRADETYAGATFVTNSYTKSGSRGTMNFYVVQTDLKDSQGRLCVECHTTVIARS